MKVRDNTEGVGAGVVGVGTLEKLVFGGEFSDCYGNADTPSNQDTREEATYFRSGEDGRFGFGEDVLVVEGAVFDLGHAETGTHLTSYSIVASLPTLVHEISASLNCAIFGKIAQIKWIRFK